MIEVVAGVPAGQCCFDILLYVADEFMHAVALLMSHVWVVVRG